jgi:hypothetical protein
MKMQTKSTLAIALASAALVGCAGQAPGVDQASAAITLEALPPLPGCDAVSGVYHRLTARPLAGSGDLIVVISRETGPLCIDTLDGARHSLRHGENGIELATSDPMPAEGDSASDPMPAGPSSAASDPMPANGSTPGSSSNPVASDPMPADSGSSAPSGKNWLATAERSGGHHSF